MVKLGIIVFANSSGLGNQSRRLTEMLKPHRILCIDSSGFSKNKKQNFHWYDNFSGYRVNGFPTHLEIKRFLEGLTHVIVCENPLNFSLLTEAKHQGIKVFIQSNFEFCDHLNKPELLPPDLFLMPSHWKVSEMAQLFGVDRVIHLPPPINPSEFAIARKENLERRPEIPSFLHIIGTLATHDRNGTLDLINSLQYTQANFRLLIRSQHDLPPEYINHDSRLTYQIGNQENVEDMYKGFDAMILPRRYGGLALTVNEALMSAIPVVMTDISPNNILLPKDWLVPAKKVDEFNGRTKIDVYGVDPKDLAKKIDWLCEADYDKIRLEAFEIGHDNFSESVLIEQYNQLFN